LLYFKIIKEKLKDYKTIKKDIFVILNKEILMRQNNVLYKH